MTYTDDTVRLMGSVPVTVELDPTSGRVTRVIVHDDSFEWTFPGSASQYDEPIPMDREAEYQRTADDAEWPAWGFGY